MSKLLSAEKVIKNIKQPLAWNKVIPPSIALPPPHSRLLIVILIYASANKRASAAASAPAPAGSLCPVMKQLFWYQSISYLSNHQSSQRNVVCIIRAFWQRQTKITPVFKNFYLSFIVGGKKLKFIDCKLVRNDHQRKPFVKVKMLRSRKKQNLSSKSICEYPNSLKNSWESKVSQIFPKMV